MYDRELTKFVDRHCEGQIDAFSEEYFYLKDLRGTFLAYWLFMALGFAVSAFWRPENQNPEWAFISKALCAVALIVCFILWIFTWLQVRRLRRRILRLDRDYPL